MDEPVGGWQLLPKKERQEMKRAVLERTLIKELRKRIWLYGIRGAAATNKARDAGIVTSIRAI